MTSVKQKRRKAGKKETRKRTPKRTQLSDVFSDLEPCFDERDVSRITRRSLASLRRDRRMGRGIPFFRIGSSIRYYPQSVRDHLKSLETR
jgi:hypothetical protein